MSAVGYGQRPVAYLLDLGLADRATVQDHLFSCTLEIGGSSPEVIVHLDRLARIVEHDYNLDSRERDTSSLTHVAHLVLEGGNQSFE